MPLTLFVVVVIDDDSKKCLSNLKSSKSINKKNVLMTAVIGNLDYKNLVPPLF